MSIARTENVSCVVVRPDNTVMGYSAVQWFTNNIAARNFIDGARDLSIVDATEYGARYNSHVAPYYERENTPQEAGPICRGCGDLREDCRCTA
jgi:hypothetical protein